MNSHPEIQRRLAAYCGGDLDPAEQQQVEQHLVDCPACRDELADLKTALRLLRSTAKVEPPPWLTGRIMAHLQEQQLEKRSWLQRIFLPLHIKLPLEVIALLTICVSGYYLSRTVETELQQPGGQQFQEQPPQSPARVETEQLPAAAKKQGETPGRAMPQVQDKVDVPAALQPLDQTVPSLPASAPAPPVDRDRSGGNVEVMKALPQAESFSRKLEGVPERRAKSIRSLEQSSDRAAPAAADRAGGAPAGLSLTPVVIRLTPADPAAAPARVREAVLLSGGTVTEEPGLQGRRLRIRLPAARQNELLELLGRLGRITERPAASLGGAGMVEMTIQW